jgi:Rad3-related DNA helicase
MTTTETPAKPAVNMPNDLSDLGIVPPSWTWLGAQKNLATLIANSKKKVIMLEAECGTGKSVIPIAAAKAANKQAIVLIRTVQLQEQYLRDINGLTMLTGRSRYICDITHQSAEYAPCTIGTRCELKGSWKNGVPLTIPECSYFRQKAAAAKSQFSVLNYAYWLREIKSKVSTFDQVDWIVCDEAHEIEQVLMDAGIVELGRRAVNAHIGNWLRGQHEISAWQEWAKASNKKVYDKFKGVEAEAKDSGLIDDNEVQPSRILDPGSAEAKEIIDRYRELKSLLEALNEIADIDEPDKWVFDSDDRFFYFEPCFGAPAFKKLLACAKEKVILMSAYLAPSALIKNLGLTEDDVDVIIAPEVYNRRNSQIFYCPTVKMNYRTTDQEWGYVAGVIDMIAAIPAHSKFKGIIHVPSVRLRDKLIELVSPATRARLLCYDGADVGIGFRRYPTKADALEQFTRSDKPLILLGQSVSTGVDLPHIPRWQIITKMSFPTLTNPALAKRNEVDKLFMSYLTLCELVQAAGRIKRAPTHDGPTFILDAQFQWFEPAMRSHMPGWFRKNLVKKGWDRWPVFKNQLRKIAFSKGLMIDV